MVYDVPVSDEFRKRFGVVALRLGDVAAVAELELEAPTEERDQRALRNQVAEGLRLIVEQLWNLTAARPVVGIVRWRGEVPGTPIVWTDQRWHRGDFLVIEPSQSSMTRKLADWILDGELPRLGVEEFGEQYDRDAAIDIIRQRVEALAPEKAAIVSLYEKLLEWLGATRSDDRTESYDASATRLNEAIPAADIVHDWLDKVREETS